jgi:hypothetical protein
MHCQIQLQYILTDTQYHDPFIQKHVIAAADVTPILQTAFVLINVDDNEHKMFMKNYFSSFQLLLNQENNELRGCSSWHKRHVNKLLASEKWQYYK